MTLLLALVVRSTLAALVALLAWATLRRRAAAFRHWVLVAGIASSAIVVPLSFLLPQWGGLPSPSRLLVSWGAPDEEKPIIATTQTDGPATSRSGSPEGRPYLQSRRSVLTQRVPTLSQAVAGVWLLGAAGSLCLLVLRLWRLSRLTASAKPIVDGPWRDLADGFAVRYGISRSIDLRRTNTPNIVATWGIARPRVLIPAGAGQWSESWIRVVLSHELAHVQRCDWAFQIVAETIRATLWLNPLVWVLCSRMRRESECACDDMVVRAGLQPDTYASHLVDIARACRDGRTLLPVLSVAGSSTLEGRITMLLKPNQDRRLPSRRAVSLLLVGMLAFGSAVASVRVFAQITTGKLTGHVYDTSGAVLPAVEVVLEDAQQTKWPTMTDSSGQFEFTPVGSGRYTLSAKLPGFRSLIDQFELKDTRDWDRLVTLQVGELEENVTVTAQRPSPRPAAAQAGTTEPVRVGGNIKPPVKIVNVPPVYPASMRDAGLEGTVPMDALIALDGTVSSVRVLSAQVHPEFARAAENAVRQWRFSQTLLNGVPVEVRMAVSVHFGLTQ